MDILRSEVDEEKKNIYTHHINQSIESSGYLKGVMLDKKNQIQAKQNIQESNQQVGIGCLGS